jgi:hypothetical protein
MGSDAPPEKLIEMLGMKYPLEMTCKVPGDKYPLGPEAVFGRGDPKIIEQMCTGDLAKLMQLKPPGGDEKELKTQEPASRPVETVQKTDYATPIETAKQPCSGCLDNGVCDPGECSDCKDCIKSTTS